MAKKSLQTIERSTGRFRRRDVLQAGAIGTLEVRVTAVDLTGLLAASTFVLSIAPPANQGTSGDDTVNNYGFDNYIYTGLGDDTVIDLDIGRGSIAIDGGCELGAVVVRPDASQFDLRLVVGFPLTVEVEVNATDHYQQDNADNAE